MAISSSNHSQLEQLLPSTQPNRLGQSPSSLLETEDIDQFLSHLVESRWQRFACQDADPLAMLFNDRGKQWTAGWDPQQQALLLLVWETDSWQNKPVWSLYRNGQLILQQVEGQSLMRSQWLTQLLESPQLPIVEPVEFVSRLNDFRFIQTASLAAEQIRQTMAVFPEFYSYIKNDLFNLLETDLNNPEWPTLEVLKLHRLQYKNTLLSIFLGTLQQGHLSANRSDIERLITTLALLQQDHQTLGKTIQPLFQGKYQEAAQEFKTLQNNCKWRIQMLKALEQTPSLVTASN